MEKDLVYVPDPKPYIKNVNRCDWLCYREKDGYDYDTNTITYDVSNMDHPYRVEVNAFPRHLPIYISDYYTRDEILEEISESDDDNLIMIFSAVLKNDNTKAEEYYISYH